MHSIFHKKNFLSFAILIAVASNLFSCIKANKSVGLDNVSTDYYLKVGSARIGLPLQTKLMDSVQSLSSNLGYVGAIRTEEFGLANFSFATNFCPSVIGWNIGKDQIVKDIHIKFLKTSTSYTESSQANIPQNIHVYRMTRIIDTTNRYNNSFDPAKDYIPTPIDTGSTIYTGSDTITIFLKKSFAKELLAAPKNLLDSTYRFIDEYKGLYFTCDPPLEGTEGGRLNGFDLSSSSGPCYIYLTINYQPTWAEGLARKDTTVLYLFGLDYIQNISSYSSKEKESQELQEYIDIEGMAGLKAYVDPLMLKDAVDKWVAENGFDPKKVLIGRATFYLPFENSSSTDINLFYPQYLYPSFRAVRDSEYHFYAPVNDVYSSDNNSGMMNRSLACYYGDFSGVFQGFFKYTKEEIAENTNMPMWFTPMVVTTNSSYYSSSSKTFSTDFTTYSKGRINGPKHANYPYVEFIYTVLP